MPLTAERRREAVEALREIDGPDHDVHLERIAEAAGEPVDRIRAEIAGWPTPLAEEAFHGPAGDFVRTVSPHSEADPAGLLVSYLLCAGSIFGSGPHYRVEADRHPARLFAVLVGDTASGRKGTAWGNARAIAAAADPTFLDRLVTGLSSGEGVIHAVRDPVIDGGDVKDEGVQDKRLTVIEPEFSAALRVMGREGNTLSPILRNSWDGTRLQTLTRNNPLRATGAHVSVLGHVTPEELKRYLTSTEVAGGLANRFLFVASRRSQELPFGGNLSDSDIAKMGTALWKAVEASRSIRDVKWSQDARPLWAGVYGELSSGRGGFVGAVTGRAAPQVIRLAVIYALLDHSAVIGADHLKAALAVWQYAEDTATYLFGHRLGNRLAEKILDSLRAASPDGLDRTSLYTATGKHASANEMDAAFTLLLDRDLARLEKVQTDGRPREVYHVTSKAKGGAR